MWDQRRTDTYDGMTAELITIEGYQDDDVHAYFARPSGTGPYPGIVLVHHLPAGTSSIARRRAASLTMAMW